MSSKRQAVNPQPTLKAWRKFRRLTLEQVANKIGITSQTVHKWEAGKVPVTLDNLSLLAKAYEASPERLLFMPTEGDLEEKFRRAHAVLTNMGSEKAERWLAMGEDLATPPSEDSKK